MSTLPNWPLRTIAIFVTVDDDTPHAIPVSAPVRATDHIILLSLHRTRDSLARLRNRPQVALAVLAEGNVAFTARGVARVVDESMADARDYAVVEIDVTVVDDHRQAAFTIEAGVDRKWIDEEEKRGLAQRVKTLQELAATRRSPSPGGLRSRQQTTGPGKERHSERTRAVSVIRTIPNVHSTDLDASRGFYTELLGFEICMDERDMLQFWSPRNHQAQVLIIGDGMPLPPGFAVDVGTPERVTEIHDQAVEQGLTILEALDDMPWGIRRFSVLDPNGARVTVLGVLAGQ